MNHTRNHAKNSKLKKDIALTDLKIDNRANLYAEQYKLNGPYMLIYENYDFDHDEAFYSLIAPGFSKCKTLSVQSDYVKNRFMHQHDFFEFMFIMHGGVTQNIEGQIYSYEEGQCCLINQNVRHVEIARESVELMFLAVSNDFFRNLVHSDIHCNETGHVIAQDNPIYDLVLKTCENGNSPQKQYWDFTPKMCPDDIVSELEQLFAALIRETAGLRSGFLPLVSGIIARVFSILLDRERYTLQQFTLPSDKEEYLFLRIQELLTQTNGRISRRDLAEKLHYDPDYMNKIVKKRTGMSLLKYGMTPNEYRQRK